MKLYVTRHGQTKWNAENKVCGITDILLTNKGIEQAQELAIKLVDYQIDVIISSPLVRAKMTAEIISNTLGKQMIIDQRLFEQNYGVFEGVSRDSKEFKDAKKHFPSRHSNGESLFQVAHRVYSLIEEMYERYPKENVLFVTHGSVCRVIHTYFDDITNEQYYEYEIENCELKQYTM